MNKRTAIVFGLLLIAAMGSGAFSSVPELEKPDYLMHLGSLEPNILRAVFFQALMAVIYMAITIITYPFVKKAGHTAALAYLSFRVTGTAFLFVGIVTLLLFLVLGRHAAMVDPSAGAYLEMTGALLRGGRDWLNHIGMILPWSIGGLFLYRSFLTSGVIPRWMSIGGLVATGLTLLATVFYMLNHIQLVSISYFALNSPTALLEIILAFYLITRGVRATSGIDPHL